MLDPNLSSAPRLTKRKALTWIISSAFIINVVAYILLQAYLHYQRETLYRLKGEITMLLQTGPRKEALKSDYLAELLDLSCDQKMRVGAFDLKHAEQKLLNSPLIAAAKVELFQPGIVYIDYTARDPIAFLADLENTALDQEGKLFPFSPFFSPKTLVEFYLGLEIDELPTWGGELRGKKWNLALKLWKIAQRPFIKEHLHVKKIDVSKAFEASLGQREVILTIEDELTITKHDHTQTYNIPRILRLNAKNYIRQLAHFLELRHEMMQQEKAMLMEHADEPIQAVAKRQVIDLRLPHLAFIKN